MNLSRRSFLKQSALAFAASNVAMPAFCESKNPNEKLNLAFVGVWGQARETMANMRSENIYALCDVDARRLGMSAEVYKGAKHYADYRKMYEELANQIDAVIVSTPDHSHAPASVQAMKMKKHCYCEKPLAHEVYEARRMAQIAAENHLATQLGTQPNAYNNYYETEELVKSGAIGKVKAVHVWTCTGNTTGYVKGVGGNVDVGMPLGCGWGQDPSQEMPPEQPVPAGLDWDLWVGPAKKLPYNEVYVPANWRRWWNFGSGQLGDFGCHYMNLPIRTLQLLNAKTVKTKGPAVNKWACPEWLRVEYTFHSANEWAVPGITLNWYDGAKIPEMEAICAEHKIPYRGNGILFIGTEGDLYANYNEHTLYPEEKYADFKAPDPFIPRSIGHYKEFLEAIKQNNPKLARCRFSYGGRLTETVLLGVVSYRSGTSFEWDPNNFRTDSPEANEYLQRVYREGWSL